jgi:hypothetical protein
MRLNLVVGAVRSEEEADHHVEDEEAGRSVGGDAGRVSAWLVHIYLL